MRKVPTLFQRDPTNRRFVASDINPSCQWVIDGEGVATRKYDGTCVMLDERGHWWARREVKPGKAEPPAFVEVEHDDITGKRVGWEPVSQSAFAKIHAQVMTDFLVDTDDLPPGTYELIGPRINQNPEGVERHQLRYHADAERLVAPRDHDGLREFLASFDGEGIVWHHPDGRMAKIKGRDFPSAT